MSAEEVVGLEPGCRRKAAFFRFGLCRHCQDRHDSARERAPRAESFSPAYGAAGDGANGLGLGDRNMQTPLSLLPDGIWARGGSNWRYAIAVGALAIGGVISSNATDLEKNASSSSPELEGWKLVWQDEFNKDGPPDPGNWRFENGFVRGKELQWYQPENAWCEKGLLIIEARSERKPNPNYEPGSNLWRKKRPYAEFTSASLSTEGFHNWLYGRFELRARIKAKPGLHPCFWTLGVQGQWPDCGEIDIMEYHRRQLRANAAWGSKSPGVPQWGSFQTNIAEFQEPEWSEKFHLYRMDWDENSIRLYRDNLLLNTIDVTKTFNANGEGRNPFRQPHYLILDLAIEKKPDDDPAHTRLP